MDQQALKEILEPEARKVLEVLKAILALKVTLEPVVRGVLKEIKETLVAEGRRDLKVTKALLVHQHSVSFVDHIPHTLAEITPNQPQLAEQ